MRYVKLGSTGMDVSPICLGHGLTLRITSRIERPRLPSRPGTNYRSTGGNGRASRRRGSGIVNPAAGLALQTSPCNLAET